MRLPLLAVAAARVCVVAAALSALACLPAAAQQIRRAVETALLKGAKTPDLGGKLTTQQMGDHVLAVI